jgi:transcriptional regulator with XRE-family HTH domain
MGCPIGARELRQRQGRVREYAGRQIREQRADAGISGRTLAAAAGVDPGHLSRIERWQAQPSLNTIVALGACLGCELGIRLFPTSGPRLRDRFQAPMVEALIREQGPLWRAEPEVPVAAARGVVDLVLRGSASNLTVVCECHSELRRLELVLRRLAEKAEAIAGQEPAGTTVARLLVVRSTAATRAIARAYEGTLTAAFPGRTTAALAAIRGVEAKWPGPTLLWADVTGGRATILERPPRGVRVGR